MATQERRDGVVQFRTQLQDRAEDYELLCPLDTAEARVRFIGCFEGKEVVWDAQLLALGVDTSHAQFLEIAAPTAQTVPIRIGLSVARIDRPTVLKAIIMVRNYKRLHRGRHEFGPHGPVARRR